MQNRKGNYHEKKTISFIDSSSPGSRYAGRMRFIGIRAHRSSAKAEASGKESSQAAEGKTETAGQAGGTAGVDVSGATGKSMWTNLSQSEMNFYVEEFNKRVPGVKVTVTVMPGNEYRTKLQNAFRTGTNAPDVATFEISDFGMYKNTDLLENLSTESYDAEALSKDMIPYVDELSRDNSGNLRGLSYQATRRFLYKKALAREYLGTDDPEELHEMLKDWDSHHRGGQAGV